MKRRRGGGAWWSALPMILLGLLVGYWIWGRSARSSSPGEARKARQAVAEVWTCSMHPQVRLPGPGTCPICSMPLIPSTDTGSTGGKFRLTLGDQARTIARVETVPIQKKTLAQEIRSVGKVQYNETALASITSRVDGYVERLFVDYTGITVDKGDHLVEIYSPDLVVTQNELLLSAGRGPMDTLLQQTKLKLIRFGITEDQIKEVLETGKATDRMTIYSPVQGTVIEKLVVEKSAVKSGDVLYRLVNLDSIWVYLDIYEYEMSLIQYGQHVELTAEAHPGRSFTGIVTFISPVLDETTRTIKVRVVVGNTDRMLKPGMFVSAMIRVPLRADGKSAPTGVEGRYFCPMHPEIIQDHGGECPLCHMSLEQLPPAEPTAPAGTPRYQCPMHPDVVQAKPGSCPRCGMALEKVAPEDPTSREILAVPVEAVLDSGTRKLVYVEREPGQFEPVEVMVGPRTGSYYPVFSGLEVGDKVARRGNFLIDSQAQIQGGPSLLSPPATPPASGRMAGSARSAGSQTRENTSPSRGKDLSHGPHQ